MEQNLFEEFQNKKNKLKSLALKARTLDGLMRNVVKNSSINWRKIF